MPKLNLRNPEKEKPKKLKLEEERRYTAENLALNYIKTGLKRDIDLISEEILLTRIGVRRENVEIKMINDAIVLVRKTIEKVLKQLN